jgi:L-ascorbate metabolism protein UlaG (beta-lactamase superfamily)
MNISPLGGPGIKITSKTNLVPDGELIIIINPYGSIKGLPKLRKQKANVVVVSQEIPEYYDVKNHDASAFVVTSPGEYEIKGALLGSAYAGKEKGRTLIFRIDIENVALGFAIGLGTIDMDALMATLEGVDVLFVPVGGKDVLDAQKAMEVVTALEPRIVIPIQYKSKSSPLTNDTVAGFIKEFGGNSPLSTAKFKLTKKELPSADRQMLLLE